MKREIKFRGKDFLGRWHYGHLHLATGSSSLMIQVDSFDSFGVLPGTVGQFTGLLDKNGKEIYEGDILEDIPLKVVVVWRDNGFRFVYTDRQHVITSWPISDMQVISNIHDNRSACKIIAWCKVSDIEPYKPIE